MMLRANDGRAPIQSAASDLVGIGRLVGWSGGKSCSASAKCRPIPPNDGMQALKALGDPRGFPHSLGKRTGVELLAKGSQPPLNPHAPHLFLIDRRRPAVVLFPLAALLLLLSELLLLNHEWSCDPKKSAWAPGAAAEQITTGNSKVHA